MGESCQNNTDSIRERKSCLSQNSRCLRLYFSVDTRLNELIVRHGELLFAYCNSFE